MDDDLAALKNADRNLFPSNFTIRALRDSRYHNTAYAIAELIDNSIEANAEQIDLLCMEQPQQVGTQTRRRITEIAVLDDGTGMDVRTLFDALKFGGGTRHASTRGIGKYGMGLPTSSMSQCKRVDVWTWQHDLDSAWHSSIDADSIEHGDHLVPLPDQNTPLPETWMRAASDAILTSRSGTVVVWSKLDKIQWKTGRTIITNTSREVGRIHRHWIDADLTRIRAASFLANRPNEKDDDTRFVANDPLYLMQPSSTPSPWDAEPMFEPWTSKPYTTTVDGKEVTLDVRYSIVKADALLTSRASVRPGDTEHGKHARHNIGVSVVREDREIVLEEAFRREGGSTENPKNRWWGCEVHFRRDCDELFGVDHNKQMVANFTQAAKTLAHDDRPTQVILDEIGVEEDIIYRVVGEIRDQTRAMISRINNLFEQRRPDSRNGRRRTAARKAARTATIADRDAISAGTERPTKTDRDRANISAKDRIAGLAEQFKESGQTDQVAYSLARMLIREDLAYQFNSTQLDGFQMFNVRSNQGILHINLNTDHPIYDLLRHIEGRLRSRNEHC